MSTSLYHSNADDIATGGDFAIVSLGDRRLVFEGLNPDEVRWFHRLASHELASAPNRPELLQALLDKEVLTINRSRTRPRVARIPSRLVRLIAAPWAPLTTGPGLAFLAASGGASILIGTIKILESPPPRSPLDPSAAIGQVLLLAFIVVVSALFHEIGHAAACIRVTGTVGAIRRSKRPMSLGLFTDISSATRASNASKAAIYAAGSAFQIALSGVIALLGAALVEISYVLLAGAITGLFIAIWCAIPRRGSDGHAYFLAAFGMDIAPRLVLEGPGGKPADLIAGWAPWIFRAVTLLALAGAALLWTAPGAPA